MYQILFNSLKSLSLIVGMLLVLNVESPAQNKRTIDSLRQVLSGKSGIQKFEALYDLTFEYLYIKNYPEALNYISEAQQVSLESSDTFKIVKTGRVKAQILTELGRSSEAINTFLFVLPIAKRNRAIANGFFVEYKFILNSLGIAYTFQANYDKALQYHFELLIVREQEGNKREISETLNNIGLVYFKLKNYEKAIAYYMKSLDFKNESNDTVFKDRLLINIGLCFNQLRQYSKAEDYINNGLSFCAPTCEKQTIMEGKFGLGVSFYGQGKLEPAQNYFEASLQLSKQIDNKRFEAENLIYLAHIFTRSNKMDSSLHALASVEKIALNAGLNELLIETYREYSRVFNQSKNFEKAAHYQGKYIHIKDSIYNEELIENIAKVQTNYAERENIKTIADNEIVIRQQRDLNIAVAVIAVLAGLLILVLQRGNRITKRVNAQLSEAKEVIQEQNVLLEIKNKDLDREVERKTIDLERVNISLKQVNEELDNFIYKTSHDIRGPLASLKGMCNVALMDVKDPVALDYLRKLDTTAERLNSILTRLLIINQINNSKLVLARIDFRAIINEVMLLEKKKGLPQKIRVVNNIENGVSIQSDRELVRIVMENLIDNAIKFYNESNRVDSFVEINVSKTDDGSVKARVIDNGIGISESNPGKLFQMFFRASERSEIGGIGLYIVKTATTKLGGKVGLLTTPEGHTEFYVTFPAYPPRLEEETDRRY